MSGKMVMEDRRLTVKQIAVNVSISVGSVDTILHEDLKMRKIFARWVPRMLTNENKASRVAMCQAMLSRDKGMNSAFFSSIVTMVKTWMPILKPNGNRLKGSTPTHRYRRNFRLSPVLRK